MTRHIPPREPATPDPIDAFFDGDLDERSSQALVNALRSDVRSADRFVGTRRTVAALKTPVEAPDLTDAIFHRLHRRRALAERLRRPWLGGGRVAAAIGLIAGLGAILLLQRYAPTPPHAPLTQFPAPTPPPVTAIARPLAPPMARIEAPARPWNTLAVGPAPVRTLAHPHESSLALFGGAGDHTRFESVSATFASRAAQAPQEWGRGRSVLSLPALTPGTGADCLGLLPRR
jgi:cell wall-associated NlpC family hydrolase